MDKLMITVAVVGAELTREDTPYLPLKPREIADEVIRAWKEGASIAHIHARNPDGSPTQNPEIYKEIITKIKEECDIIIQVSSGGAVGMTPDERLGPVTLSPEMATLTTGTVNFGSDVFMNPLNEIEIFAQKMQHYNVAPEFEIFDVGMIDTALRLVKKGLVSDHLHFDFVMGVPGGIPGTGKNLLHLIDLIPQDATWSVAGVGRAELPLASMAIALGGHVRVGLEDNIYYRRGELATSNAQLVERIVRIAREMEREVATPSEARQILRLPRNT